MDRLEIDCEDGARLAVDVEGRGHDVLLVSGLGGTSAFWSGVGERLSRHHRVIRFDQRGIGRSTRGAVECTIAQLARDCISILDALDVARSAVVGHSAGGLIAQTLCLDAGARVTATVLGATWGRRERYIDALFGSRLALLEADATQYAVNSALLSYSPSWLAQHWLVVEAAEAAAPIGEPAARVVAERIAALRAFDRDDELPRLRHPTLVVGAADDVIAPFFMQEYLATRIVHAALEQLPGGGHFFPVAHAEDYATLLSRWLQNHAGT